MTLCYERMNQSQLTLRKFEGTRANTIFTDLMPGKTRSKGRRKSFPGGVKS